MKKYILLLIALIGTSTLIKSQDYRFIPDFNFRWYLSDMGCHFSPSGDSLDITDPIVTDTSVINCSRRGISSIEGIQYFTSLTQLDCNFNYITSIPTSLPSNLTYLACGGNLLTGLPPLPSNLTYLSCVDNTITSLPALPSSLTQLICRSNSLTSLPALPSSLTALWCAFNSISSLPTLPSMLSVLSCDHNTLSSLPTLPSTITAIYCNNNVLTSLPTLAPYLIYLHCDHNLLASIPSLPATLRVLESDHNPNITCLPFIPNSMSYFTYDTISLICMPNIVPGAYYEPIATTRPLCNPYIHPCPSSISISGTAYSDADADCILDSVENKLSNISFVLQKDSIIIQQVSSASNGLYEFNTLVMDTYTIHIDTLDIPFYPSCLVNGYDTLVIDSSTLIGTERNYAFQCKDGFDVGTTGLVSTGIITPGLIANFDLHAGDMAAIFGMHCSSLSGKISIDFNSPMHYAGVMSGTLVPDTVLPNRIVWNISNFYTLDFNNAIKPNFLVDSTAQDGNLVCFSTEVNPISGDRVPMNNVFQQCFEVFTSYDPNLKEVSPIGSISSTQDWLYYTIHFQNTGDIAARNIYVLDIIDSNLNINTIQAIGASHGQFMDVFNATRLVRFNFININLPDSATSETASHGWVQFRIKPNTALTEGTQISNNASILFDLNAPVVTNTVSNLVCNSPSTYYQNRTINSTQYLLVGSHTYTRSGIYIDQLANIHGCDSIVHTTLTVITCPSTTIQNQTIVIYNGDSLQVGIHTYRSAGIYTDTFKTADSICDSLVLITHLTVVTCGTVNIVNQTINMHNGDTIRVGTHAYHTFGSYVDTIKTRDGYCDSIIINTNINIISCPFITTSAQSITIYTGDSVRIGSQTYHIAGVYIDTINTVDGICDSLIVTTNLYVINCAPADTLTQYVTIFSGDSIRVANTIYHLAGSYIDTIISSNGHCDSLIITTHLSVVTCAPLDTLMQNINIFDGDSIQVGIHTYDTTGIYMDTLITSDGFCDSLIIITDLVVTLCPSIDTIVQNITIYIGSQITINGHTYTANGIYRDTFQDISGRCDSFVVITYLSVINGIALVNDKFISIFPNPAIAEVLIQLEGVSNEPISIVDMYGRLVFEATISQNRYIIHTTTWSNGTYIVQCGAHREKLIVRH